MDAASPKLLAKVVAASPTTGAADWPWGHDGRWRGPTSSRCLVNVKHVGKSEKILANHLDIPWGCTHHTQKRLCTPFLFPVFGKMSMLDSYSTPNFQVSEVWTELIICMAPSPTKRPVFPLLVGGLLSMGCLGLTAPSEVGRSLGDKGKCERTLCYKGENSGL